VSRQAENRRNEIRFTERTHLQDTLTVMLFLSGALLMYTALIVPVQICLWAYDDPCDIFPTLQFDIIVDTFFLVPAQHTELAVDGRVVISVDEK
jgi:hypothetical protein